MFLLADYGKVFLWTSSSKSQMLLLKKNNFYIPQILTVLEVWIFQGFLPFTWENQIKWMENQMICNILFGNFQRIWTAIWDNAIFKLIYLPWSRYFFHHIKFYSFTFMHKEEDMGICGVVMLLIFLLCDIAVNKIRSCGLVVISNHTVCDVFFILNLRCLVKKSYLRTLCDVVVYFLTHLTNLPLSSCQNLFTSRVDVFPFSRNFLDH